MARSGQDVWSESTEVLKYLLSLVSLFWMKLGRYLLEMVLLNMEVEWGGEKSELEGDLLTSLGEWEKAAGSSVRIATTSRIPGMSVLNLSSKSHELSCYGQYPPSPPQSSSRLFDNLPDHHSFRKDVACDAKSILLAWTP
jgi:hypothetical protein